MMQTLTKKKPIKRKPIRRPNLVQEVVEQLQADIVEGRATAGSTLPSEGELSTQFGVSRTVLREAMRILVSRGLVEVSQGRAPRVREANPDTVVDSINTFLQRGDHSIETLSEVRETLETRAAELAAERATPDHIAALETAVLHLKTAKNLQEQVQAEIEFHECLAAATENPVFIILQRVLSKLMPEYLHYAMKSLGLNHAEDDHEPILNAIKKKDADAASAFMSRHFRMIEEKAKRIKQAKGRSA